MSRASNSLLLTFSAAGAFVLLAGFVAAGALTGFDQWSCDHLMPLAGGTSGGPPTFLESLVPLFHASWHPVGAAVAQIVTLPGQVLISFAIVTVGAWKLRSPVWIFAWLGVVSVELVTRHVLTRPALFRDGVHVTAFDSSWPSGQRAAVRTRRGRRRNGVAASEDSGRGWLVAAVLLLVIAGFHTPTDVVGGLLLALLACGAVGAAGAARALREP